MSKRAGSGIRKSAAAVVALALLVATLALSTSVAAAANVPVPEGAGKPVAATGIGTPAAMKDPRCDTTAPTAGVYGRWSSALQGAGPLCVKPWKEGDDNGGATSQGVTKDKVKVVAVVPGSTQIQAILSAGTTAPRNLATGTAGNFPDSINDNLQPFMEYYETWGRDIEVSVYESGGNDEAAQRADAVAILAMKPFAVLDMLTTGLDVLDTQVAAGKVPVWGYATSTSKAIAQAPYRWGQNDAQAAVIASAEVLGKQLINKKAEFGGDDVKNSNRVFGTVYLNGTIDIDRFTSEFKKYGGKSVLDMSYDGPGSVRGDPAKAAEFAPTVVQRLKDAGVTTVVLFSDTAMNSAMQNQAEQQNYHPEWFTSGGFYQDLPILNRGNPEAQMAHMFGLSNFPPYVAPSLVATIGGQEWYWGKNSYTSNSAASVPLGWLMLGVHTAGPNLTPKTFQQGLFSIPATGTGAGSTNPISLTTGFGKNPGLPYDEYMFTGFDFVPAWYDVNTTGPSSIVGTIGKGVLQLLDGGKRYLAGDFPKKQFAWYDPSGSIVELTTLPGVQPQPAPACTTCAVATGGKAGAADPKTIVGVWHGTGAQTAASGS